MVPVLPSAYDALIISPSDTFCIAFKKFLKSLYYDYLIMRYETNEDGSLGDGLTADLCATMECPEIVTE